MRVETSEFWEQRYQAGTARWDLGQAAPPLIDLLVTSAWVPGRVAVLGCGCGHDAFLFAKQGFEVMGFDFAPSAIATAKAIAAQNHSDAQFLQRDIFDLTPEFAGGFDYIVEHTCFCAIDPQQRPRYVQLVHHLLKAQGTLIALFFTHDRPGGPPFGSTIPEIQQLFSPWFEIVDLSPAPRSIPERQGEEHLGIFHPVFHPGAPKLMGTLA